MTSIRSRDLPGHIPRGPAPVGSHNPPGNAVADPLFVSAAGRAAGFWEPVRRFLAFHLLLHGSLNGASSGFGQERSTGGGEPVSENSALDAGAFSPRG